MSKNTYQTYTEQTPITTYRSDFMRRGAICSALATRHPSLAAVATEAKNTVTQIDSRLAALQSAEDDQLVTDAIEDAEKIDVVDVYTEMRRTMFAKKYDVATMLPETPSALGRMGADNFTHRVEQAISHLKTLPESDPARVTFLPKLEIEFAEFKTADAAEDTTRTALKTARMALTLYKSELARLREVQLGTILTVLEDREKTAMFTLPWRKTSRTHVDTPSEQTTTP